jgi:hypothetical protein
MDSVSSAIEHLEPATSRLSRPVSGLPNRCESLVRLATPLDAVRYVRALTSLLYGSSSKVIAKLESGKVRDDFSSKEVADRVGHGLIESIRFFLESMKWHFDIELVVGGG